MVDDLRQRRSGTQFGRTQVFNLVTAGVLGLTVVSCLTALILLLKPGGGGQAQVEPTLFIIPTSSTTPVAPTQGLTWTPSPTITATHTATPSETPTETLEPTETGTLSPTLTYTPTETPIPTDTPLPTNTLTPSNTPVRTATNTPNPFDYMLRDGTITYTSNFANSAGCNWAGIAGVVFDTAGHHKVGITVHLTGGGLDAYETSGDRTAYGASGWEFYLNDHPIADGTFFIQLENATGGALSEKITVRTIDNCNSNLAYLVFEEVP